MHFIDLALRLPYILKGALVAQVALVSNTFVCLKLRKGKMRQRIVGFCIVLALAIILCIFHCDIVSASEDSSSGGDATCSYESSISKADVSCTDFVPLVDAPQRLSESIVLDLSQEYYASQGKEAFASGTVPYFISSNAKVARAYARSIVAYAADLCAMRKLDFDAPVRN